jgi:hypothetical protein
MEEAEHKEKLAKHRRRIVKIALFSFLGLWAFVIILMQIILTPKVLTGIVNKAAAQYVNGDVNFGKISGSMLKSFPNLNVTIDDFSLTYPHGRFTSYDSLGTKGRLLALGRGASKDTLASFNKLSVSVNYISIIFGRIHIPNAALDKPRIFAHYYDSTAANWNIFKIAKDTTKVEKKSSGMPNIILNKISLTGRPLIVFTDQQDTISGLMKLRKMLFNGKVKTANLKKNKISFTLDSMMLAARLPADTVAVFLNRFKIKDKLNKKMSFSAQANTFLGLSSFGRMEIPIEMSGKLFFPKERRHSAVALEDFKAQIATIPIEGKGEAIFYGDSTFIKANAAIKDCSVNDLIKYFAKNFYPDAKKIKTDATINFTARCNGYYNSQKKTLPNLRAELNIPESRLAYKGFTKNGIIKLSANAKNGSKGTLNAIIDQLVFKFNGINFNAKAQAMSLLGEDPIYGIDAKASASLDSLIKMMSNNKGYHAHGKIAANLKGNIKQSQLSLYNFGKAKLEGSVKSDVISFDSQPDTIFAYINKADIRLTSMSFDKNNHATGKKSDDLSVLASIDSLNLKYKKDIFVRGRKLAFTGKNPITGHVQEGHVENPVIGKLTAERLGMKGADSLLVGVRNTNNTFTLAQEHHARYHLPVLSFTSENGGLFVRQGVNRIGLKDAGFSATAKMHTAVQNQKRKHFLDSLHRVYPGVPRDSLFRTEMRHRMATHRMPDFLSEEDFRKQDINIRLGDEMAKYIREWDIAGKLNVPQGIVVTPYFPLRNKLSNVKGTFTNDKITLNNFTFKPGESDVSASGTLSGLKRALTSMGLLKLDLKIRSNRLNANELLEAYQRGSKFIAANAIKLNENMSDEEYMKTVAQTASKDTTLTYSLIVVPANLIANVSLQCNEVDYSDLKISWLAADLAMKERCAQITNTIATSNMGDIYFEGFYSTKTKKDIRAGFDLNMDDITADKVIQLFPSVDSIIPMLKSFKGNLDCEMAATTDLDTNMNFITPTIKGVMQIGGKKLSLDETGGIKKLARLLLFKNKDTGYIDDMSVNGLIDNNTMEIFPFVLKMDRYTLAMSGKQNFDQTFKYHISVLKSPIPFRFGINVFGSFDNWKYRLTRARYKNTNVPVFTQQLDTVRRNLVYSIHNIFERGVELAMKENASAKNMIERQKTSIGYNPDAPVDTLSAKEKHQMDSLSYAYEHPVDSSLNAAINSMESTPNQNVVTPDNDEAVNTKLQAAFDKQMDKKEAVENKKEMRKEAAAERKQRAAERKSKKSK